MKEAHRLPRPLLGWKRRKKMTSLEAARLSLGKWQYIMKFCQEEECEPKEKERFYFRYAYADTCALCAIHLVSKTGCTNCPLYRVGAGCNLIFSPWANLHRSKNPERKFGLMKKMIAALRRAIKYAEEHEDMQAPLKVGAPV